MATQLLYLRQPKITGYALGGLNLDGQHCSFNLPTDCPANLGSIAEALGIALEEEGDQDLWTTAHPEYDWNYAIWVDTFSVSSTTCPEKTTTWRHLVIRKWGWLENQQTRYRSGGYAAQTDDPRIVEARIRAEIEAKEKRRQECLGLEKAEQADVEALSAMPLSALELEMRVREAVDPAGAGRARRVYHRRLEQEREERALEQMVELRERLAPGAMRQVGNDLWEVEEVGYRSEGQDILTVPVKGWHNQIRGTWSLEWWLRVFSSGKTGTFPPLAVRRKLEEVGESPLRAKRVELGDRAAWVGTFKAVWEDTSHLVRSQTITKKLAEMAG